MRAALVVLALACATATPASAQVFAGNWECQAGGVQAGLLTIYGPSYIYTSPVFSDPLSGGGTVTGYSDGVTFNDGPLVTNLGLAAGRLIPGDSGRGQMQLESQTAVVLNCFAM